MLCVAQEFPSIDYKVPRAVALKSVIWEQDELKVVIFGGTVDDREWVSHIVMTQVQPYVAIKIRCTLLTNPSELRDVYDIRVAVRNVPEKYVYWDGKDINYDGIEAWSMIGTDARSVDFPLATMYLGTLDDASSSSLLSIMTGRTIIHEFGHALGLVHEHSHPQSPIQWNVNALYSYYKQPPNEWSPEKVDANILKRYGTQDTVYTEYDPYSIMHYAFNRTLVTNYDELGIRTNTHFSEQDIKLLNSLYDGDGILRSYLNPAGDYRFLKIVANVLGLLVPIFLGFLSLTSDAFRIVSVMAMFMVFMAYVLVLYFEFLG